MRADLPRVFEPAVLPNGAPNPRHLARRGTSRGRGPRRSPARAATGSGSAAADVAFPGGSFAPTRVAVRCAASGEGRVPGYRRRGSGPGASARGRGAGPGHGRLDGIGRRAGAAAAMTARSLIGWARPCAPTCGRVRPHGGRRPPRRAVAVDHQRVSLRRRAGPPVRGQPEPEMGAPPGTSLHRYATELDLGPPGAYGWLAANARRFGFIHRYAWEAWHYGFGANPRDRAAPGPVRARGLGAARWGQRPGQTRSAELRSAPIPRSDRARGPALERADGVCSRRSSTRSPASTPSPRVPAGAQGIAQFMPGTARGLRARQPQRPRARRSTRRLT